MENVCFEWNLVPFLVKTKIVDELSFRSLPFFASCSRECFYLFNRFRAFHVVDSFSIFIQIENDGSFEAEISEGEDVNDLQEKDENVFDRNAANHLKVDLEHFEKHDFNDDVDGIKHFLKHVHAVGSIELDICCADSDDANRVLDEIWSELGRGLESAQKLIVHRFPNRLFPSLFLKAERVESLGLLSARRSFSDRVDFEVLRQSLPNLRTPLRRFVCDYLIRPNDQLLEMISSKSKNLELLFIFGVSDEAIHEFIKKPLFAPKCKLIFSFSEGFYQWRQVGKAIECAADSTTKLSVTNLPAAFYLEKNRCRLLVALVKPYRAFV
uniref:Uncharacterized protein n=2 Tax=Panagrolaimus sp. JU765 TaxID=591449 RepID=A0AC34QKZ9_9BILA